MIDIFKLLGAGVAGYVVYGFVTGEIYARSRAWGRSFRRDHDPWNYWGAMISYIWLSIALILFFGPRGRQ